MKMATQTAAAAPSRPSETRRAQPSAEMKVNVAEDRNDEAGRESHRRHRPQADRSTKSSAPPRSAKGDRESRSAFDEKRDHCGDAGPAEPRKIGRIAPAVRTALAPTHLRQDRGQNSDRARGSDEDGVHSRVKGRARVCGDNTETTPSIPKIIMAPMNTKRPHLHMGARPTSKGANPIDCNRLTIRWIGSFDHEKKLRKALGHVPVHLSANVAIALLGFSEGRLARRSFQWRQFFEQDEKRLRLSEEDTEILFDRLPGVLAVNGRRLDKPEPPQVSGARR